MFPGSACINVFKNSHGYLVLHDPSGGLLNRTAASVTEDTGKVQFTIKESKVNTSGTRMTIRVQGSFGPGAPLGTGLKGLPTDDGSCPDGGNVSITLNGDTQPTSTFYVTYTNDPPNP